MRQDQVSTTGTAALGQVIAGGCTVLRLKLWPTERGSAPKPIAVAGLDVPFDVGTSQSGPIRVLCIGPGEWLLVSSEGAARLRERVETPIAESGVALIDLSDGLNKIEISGPFGRDILAKGCGLDFHPLNFHAGRCARTRFAKVPVVIDCIDDAPRFQVYVPRSYSTYLHAWLKEAAAQFDHIW